MKRKLRALHHLTPFHSILSAFSIFSGPLLLNFLIHAMHERNLSALKRNTKKTMGLQKSRYLPASLTFESALSSVFVAFGSVESSRCFTGPSGHLTSPPEGISMCEQAQKERHEVHVSMCCQQVFPGSSLFVNPIH